MLFECSLTPTLSLTSWTHPSPPHALRASYRRCPRVNVTKKNLPMIPFSVLTVLLSSLKVLRTWWWATKVWVLFLTHLFASITHALLHLPLCLSLSLPCAESTSHPPPLVGFFPGLHSLWLGAESMDGLVFSIIPLLVSLSLCFSLAVFVFAQLPFNSLCRFFSDLCSVIFKRPPCHCRSPNSHRGKNTFKPVDDVSCGDSRGFVRSLCECASLYCRDPNLESVSHLFDIHAFSLISVIVVFWHVSPREASISSACPHAWSP